MALLSKITVKINGEKLRNFQAVTINQNLYGIDNFEIICRYEDIEKLDDFLIEKSKDFLGGKILIQTSFKDKDIEKDGIFFKGFVTEINSNRSGMADYDLVVISGGSNEIALNRKPTNRAFNDKTLDEIVKDVVKNYDLNPKIASKNKQKFPYIVQFEESDLEFIKRLAIRYGEWCYYNGNELIFGKLAQPAERNITLGIDLNDFNYELRANPVNFKLYSVDTIFPGYKKGDSSDKWLFTYQSGKKSKIENNLNEYGKHALKTSQKLYPESGVDYFEHLNVDSKDFKKALNEVGEIEETTNAVNLTDLSGSSVNGFINAGDFITINCPKKDGKNNNYGKYLITSIQHNLDNDNLTYQNSFSAIPGEITVPENTNPYFVRTSSNQIGIVSNNKDPKKLGRIKIRFPWMKDSGSGVSTPWVRIVTPYANVKSGHYFVPQRYARVLVGFEDGDIEKPYCFGSLFDDNALPDPEWVGNTSENQAKIQAIRSGEHNTIEFHDTAGEEKITIYDKEDKNRITLNSAEKTLTIHADGDLIISANKIQMIAKEEIKMECDEKTGTILTTDKMHHYSAGKIDMANDGDMSLEAININVEADVDLKTKGTNVEIKANASLKAEGKANTEISSTGVTVVKGSIVKIN